jgi:hypothetical protein
VIFKVTSRLIVDEDFVQTRGSLNNFYWNAFFPRAIILTCYGFLNYTWATQLQNTMMLPIRRQPNDSGFFLWHSR